MRGSARLAIFFGLYLRNDPAVRAIAEAQGWPGGAVWGVHRLRSLHAERDEEAIALIHRPSALGDWQFELGWARPTRDAHFVLQPATLGMPHGDDASAQDELRSLIELYGLALDAPLQWHAVALIER